MNNTFQDLVTAWELPPAWIEQTEFRYQEIGLAPNDPLVLLHLEEDTDDTELWRARVEDSLDVPFLRILSAEFRFNSQQWDLDQEHLIFVLRAEFDVQSIMFIDNWKALDPFAEARAYTYASPMVPPVYARHFELQTLEQFSHILQRYCLHLKKDTE